MDVICGLLWVYIGVDFHDGSLLVASLMIVFSLPVMIADETPSGVERTV